MAGKNQRSIGFGAAENRTAEEQKKVAADRKQTRKLISGFVKLFDFTNLTKSQAKYVAIRAFVPDSYKMTQKDIAEIIGVTDRSIRLFNVHPEVVASLNRVGPIISTKNLPAMIARQEAIALAGDDREATQAFKALTAYSFKANDVQKDLPHDDVSGQNLSGTIDGRKLEPDEEQRIFGEIAVAFRDGQAEGS